MRKLTLLTSVLLASSFQTVNVSAQCMNTINCQTLGYTKTSCTKGGVKCPTGNYWYCPKDTTTPQCSSSYKYTCTGYLQSPSGTACNGLYTSCTCTSGYQWTNGSCQKKEIAWGTCTGLVQNCSIGDILNSDGTCSTNKISGKTPIGVVVYKSGNCGQALALENIGNERWSTEYVDISSIQNYYTPMDVINDWNSCNNTSAMLAQGEKYYPAASAVVRYFPTGLSASQGKWCLPSAGIWNMVIQNQKVINTAISNANGAELENYAIYWSSTEYSNKLVWGCKFPSGFGSGYLKYDYAYIRPVLQF